MGLEGRLKRLESKVRPMDIAPEHFDLDQCLANVGLVPAAVRELARSQCSSLAEATCEMLGTEVRDFKRELWDAVYSVR